MASGIVSRWPVLLSLPLFDDERDEEGQLTDAGVERLCGCARDAYAELCPNIDWSTVEIGAVDIRRGGRVLAGRNVTVSIGVVEVFDDSFTIAARVRPESGDA